MGYEEPTVVYDLLSTAPRYPFASGKLEQAFAFLHSCRQSPPKPGRHTLDGEELYANVMAYDTAPPAPDAPGEVHTAYMDLQFVVQGREDVYCGFLPEMERLVQALPDEDTETYQGPLRPLRLSGDEFLLLLPGEVHRPGGACGGLPQAVLKVVVKIKV